MLCVILGTVNCSLEHLWAFLGIVKCISCESEMFIRALWVILGTVNYMSCEFGVFSRASLDFLENCEVYVL
ncbi:4198_t:CDS:2 [Cetraspora pellucida]|uniref:4198_t:CDS:1 n=1 Tax=Cetraspora pellucida TaxID=1433469 RepID=A0A9N9F6N2_9GLOM|nr:4198_t:CDS:2 [Cetraspora pellucida]